MSLDEDILGDKNFIQNISNDPNIKKIMFKDINKLKTQILQMSLNEGFECTVCHNTYCQCGFKYAIVYDNHDIEFFNGLLNGLLRGKFLIESFKRSGQKDIKKYLSENAHILLLKNEKRLLNIFNKKLDNFEKVEILQESKMVNTPNEIFPLPYDNDNSELVTDGSVTIEPDIITY